MKNEIIEYINDSSIDTGLLIADMPTGYGKTYSAVNAIYDYIHKENGNKKQFFVTTLIKNLPLEEIKNTYMKHKNYNFEKDVIVIKSNYDYVYENILNVVIPDEFKVDSYYQLIEKVKMLKSLENNNEKSYMYVKSVTEEEIRTKLEVDFRRDIMNIIKKHLPKSKDKKINIIRNNTQYKWIGQIYPTVFISDYKVYLLSIDKFLVKNTVLVEPSYYFITNEITTNSIIYIDEFDSGKETIQSALIDKALTSKHDYIKLFLQIHNTFVGHEFSKIISDINNEWINNTESKYNLDELKKEAFQIYEEFNLKYNYKTVANVIDKRQSFLFNDSSYHTMLRNNCNYIRAKVDDEEKQVRIYFENKNEYYKNRKEDDIIVYSLVRNISSFLSKFKFMILTLATKFTSKINNNRNDEEDELSLENAMRTLYREFSLSKEQILLLMNDMCDEKVVKEKKQELIPDMTFYNNGFKYFEFEDSDSHFNETIFNYVDLYDTPEKIIVYLAMKAKLVGISATASIDTVTGNYDLGYIKSKLIEKLRFVSKETYEGIRNELEETWQKYKSGEIQIVSEILNINTNSLDLRERLERIFDDKKLVKKYANKLMINAGHNQYIWRRYCNIFLAIKEFILKDDIHSFLCLNMVLPKVNGDKSSFELDIFVEVLTDMAIYYNKQLDHNNLVVLNSENFEENKKKISYSLSNGSKLFIMSTYKTIGAGQNLQYKIPNIKELIKIAEAKGEGDSRTNFKDIDAIFLGDITNLAVNINDIENFNKTSLLKYFMQIEYLYENDEISYSTLDRLIKLGFKKYSKINDIDSIYNELSKSKSIKRHATKDVMQAIGRMSRTFVKNPNIYIYTVQELIDKIDTECLNGKILSPEMNAFKELVESMGYKYSDEEEKVLNKAERISSRGKNHIMKMLSRRWNENSMKLWKELRLITLTNPTASKKEWDENNIINSLYIEAGYELDSYLFAQKGDFSDVIIDFKNDKVVFSNSDRCEGRYVSKVSEEDSRLSTILNYIGLRKHFMKMGYATEFKKDKYILSPVLFNNIYKGALGEEAGKYILENELGIKLKEIDDPDKFEFFDFEIGDGIYIDFKHWKHTYRQDKDRKQAKEEIRKKLDNINGKKVYIINILARSEYEEHSQVDGKIIEIPFLIDENGKVNEKALDLLKGELLNDN